MAMMVLSCRSMKVAITVEEEELDKQQHARESSEMLNNIAFSSLPYGTSRPSTVAAAGTARGRHCKVVPGGELGERCGCASPGEPARRGPCEDANAEKQGVMQTNPCRPRPCSRGILFACLHPKKMDKGCGMLGSCCASAMRYSYTKEQPASSASNLTTNSSRKVLTTSAPATSSIWRWPP